MLNTVPCPYCAQEHPGVVCSLIKAVEYGDPANPSQATRVEFFAPIDYHRPLQNGASAPAMPYPTLRKETDADDGHEEA